MKPLLLMLVAALLPLASMRGQSYLRHNFSFGLGAGQPRGELRNVFSGSFGLAGSYGYRFHEYFQLDGGVETLFGAAGVKDFLPSEYGNLRIRDYQVLVPMGGRAILPLFDERIHISGGGGAAFLRYAERLRQPSEYFTISCDQVCTARSGWGYYGLLGANVALDRARNFRLGVVSRVHRGHTEGEPLGQVQQIRTRDRWINVFGEFTFSF